MHDAFRIIDANANRAREALRVMEDAARFALDDATLSHMAKTVRHGLREALAPIAAELEQHRDTPGDVGTQITTPAEQSRDGLAGVVRAAGKRLSEALRSIEEYSKLLGDHMEAASQTPQAIERLRYAGYTLEQRLNEAMQPGRPSSWRLCVLLTESLCTHHPWQAVLEQAVAGGADCVQLREKQMAGHALEARAADVVERVREHRGDGHHVSVIINDRADIAAGCGADGVHVGQEDMGVAAIRRAFGRSLLVGVSTSRLDEAAQALEDGADYCGVGPMHATSTKRKDHIVGPGYAQAFARWGGLPGLAIGGITSATIAAVAATGITGVAVSGAVCGSPDPRGVTTRLIETLTQFQQADPE